MRVGRVRRVKRTHQLEILAVAAARIEQDELANLVLGDQRLELLVDTHRAPLPSLIRYGPGLTRLDDLRKLADHRALPTDLNLLILQQTCGPTTIAPAEHGRGSEPWQTWCTKTVS